MSTSTIPAKPVIGQPNGHGGLNTIYDIYDWEKNFGGIISNEGPDNDIFQISGTPEAQAGGKEGLDFARRLYGQGLGDIGRDAADYSKMVKERLDTDSSKADLYRQGANRRIAQSANKLGMAGASMGEAQEQAYRRSNAEAAAMNQEYKDKALALYGRNISAKQQGVAGQYMAGKGIGNASTKVNVPEPDSGCFLCIIATNMFLNREINKNALLDIFRFGRSFNRETFIGYILIANILIKIKNGIFIKKVMVPAFISYSNNKPNMVANLTIFLSKIVGKIYSKTNFTYHLRVVDKYRKNHETMKRKIKC
jgi:hypothetical protein